MKIRKELIIGIIVIIAGVLLYIGISFLKGGTLFKKGVNYYAVYNRVDGLNNASPVLYNGYRIGKVQQIFFSTKQNGKIIVMFNVTNNILKIDKDAQATIISQDLLGSKAIQISLGKSKILAQNGDTLNSSMEQSLKEEVNTQLLPLKNKVSDLVSTVDSTVTIFAAIFNDKSRKNIKNSFSDLESSINTLKNASQRIDTLVKKQSGNIGKILDNVQHITANLNNNQAEINNILENFSSISDTLAKAQIASTITNVKESLKEFTTLLDKINKGQGTLGQLAKNDTLYYNLQKSSAQLDLLLKDMREYPGRYVHFSLFGRRYKPYKGTGKVDYSNTKEKKEKNNKK